MKLQLFDDATGKPSGSIEIPDEIMTYARIVEVWMHENGVIAIRDISLRTQCHNFSKGLPCPWEIQQAAESVAKWMKESGARMLAGLKYG